MKSTAEARAFELLREADPLSSADWQRLGERAVVRAQDVLAAAMRERPRFPDRPSRPRRRKLSGVAMALLLALALPIAASALGLEIPVLDFSRAEKAPSRAVANFESLSVGAPAGLDPQVIAGEARRLETTTVTGQARTLWIAPTEAGGYCYLWADAGGGGCDRLGTSPLIVSWWRNAPRPVGDSDARSAQGDVEGIAVHMSARYVANVELRFADGAVVRPPITWVSDPIDHGFFVYSFRPEQRSGTDQLAAVVALDGDGNVVTSERRCCEAQSGRPADAIVSEKRVAASVATAAGMAVIWEAPTRYEGTCAWFEFRGSSEPLGRCAAKGYERSEGIALRPYPAEDTVLVYGRAADRYREFDFRYADGAVERVKVIGQYLLAEIAPSHLRPETRLVAVTARGPDGKAIPAPTFSFAASGAGDGSCSPVLPRPKGATCRAR